MELGQWLPDEFEQRRHANDEVRNERAANDVLSFARVDQRLGVQRHTDDGDDLPAEKTRNMRQIG